MARAEDALKPGAPQLHDTVPGNLCAHVEYGDKAATQKAIDEAEVRVHLDITIPRQLHQPLETRATMAQYDEGTGEYTLYTNTQIPHGNKFMICNLVMGIPYNKLRVIVPAIGGAYGSKGYLYQDAPLMLFLAKEVGTAREMGGHARRAVGHDGAQPWAAAARDARRARRTARSRRYR